MDDERLKSLSGGNYFDELLACICAKYQRGWLVTGVTYETQRDYSFMARIPCLNLNELFMKHVQQGRISCYLISRWLAQQARLRL